MHLPTAKPKPLKRGNGQTRRLAAIKALKNRKTNSTGKRRLEPRPRPTKAKTEKSNPPSSQKLSRKIYNPCSKINKTPPFTENMILDMLEKK